MLYGVSTLDAVVCPWMCLCICCYWFCILLQLYFSCRVLNCTVYCILICRFLLYFTYQMILVSDSKTSWMMSPSLWFPVWNPWGVFHSSFSLLQLSVRAIFSVIEESDCSAFVHRLWCWSGFCRFSPPLSSFNYLFIYLLTFNYNYTGFH